MLFRSQPSDDAVPWERAYRVPLTPEAVGRKRIAAQLFQSQQEDRDENSGPVLPPFVLDRLLVVGEVVFR